MKHAAIFCTLLACVYCGALSAQDLTSPRTMERRVLIDINPFSFCDKAILFDPGAFRVDEASNTIIGLYVPSNGIWQRVQSFPPLDTVTSSTTQPPPELLCKMGSRHQDTPDWVVAHLGITTEQWMRARELKKDPSIPNANVLKMIGQAVDLERVDNATRWLFESIQLPSNLKSQIPGGGIYFHIENTLSEQRAPFIFDGATKALLIEAKIGMSELQLQGSATATVTIGVSMQTKDVNGKLSPLPLIVGVMHSKAANREIVGWDGRNTYAGTPLSDKATFITPVAGNQKSAQWDGRAVFSFKLDSDSIARLIKATNVARIKHGQPPLDSCLSLVRLKGLDFRNENRFLDKGSVKIILDAEYLRAFRLVLGTGAVNPVR